MVSLLIGAVLIVGGAILSRIERLMVAWLGPPLAAIYPTYRAEVKAFTLQAVISCPGCKRRFVVQDGTLVQAHRESTP